MHIGFICNEYPPSKHGGIGSFTKDLAEALYEKGYAVTIIGYYLESILKLDDVVDEVLNGIRVIRYPASKVFDFIPLNTLYLRYKLFYEIKNLHQKNSFDLIESPGGSGWLPFGLPSKIPLVSRLHGGEVYTAFQLGKKVSRLIKVLEKKQLQNSQTIISVSSYTANTIYNLLKIKKKYEVIYNSVDSQLFGENDCKITHEKGLIVFSGTIKKAKGVEELIEAMNIVFKENKEAHLILAGKIPDTKESKNYELYLRDLLDISYQDRVEFTGLLDRNLELIPLYKKAEVCCFPSYVESFSLVPLEAMSLGKAVVFTKLTSGREAIIDKESGLLCNPKDPKDIAEKILILQKDKRLREKIALSGQKRVLEKFTFKTWIKENIKIYQQVIG